jgi:peptidyl-prolyl cis-trans isomerase C
VTLRVNGRVIDEQEILAEMQYHPAADATAAARLAARALAVRELIRQEAERRGYDADADGIDALLEDAVEVEEPDEAACVACYEAHPERMRSPDLVEAQHILIAAAPDDAEGRAAAQKKAETLLAELEHAPERFGVIARDHSDCASKSNDGMLGQITPGSTVPEFETFLFSLDAGETCPRPVASRYGLHIVRCLARAPGALLPYTHVRPRIADQLRALAWRRAVARFVAGLAARAELSGVDLQAGAGEGV